ncbi:RES family NAD+ phosphorylase [Streptomyces sp. 2323.1]|uniref:RES family NAD+ phosphorylase n=1 Tax=Streptomyces sp. 2323.1 TaxID=1938841 RepID=UPI00133131A0|nr:RES family NAD+ phosphorylase [Streptomyces sp. 2323.1]
MYELDSNTDLFRIYLREVDGRAGSPAWFCDGLKHICRFDLTGGLGTCYTSSSAEGAFIEVFYRVAGKGVPQDKVDERFLATMRVSRPRLLVNLNVNANLGVMGIDAELIHEMDEKYPRSRAFAQRAWGERLRGVRWNGLRNLDGTRVNFALFSEFSGDQEGKLLHVESHGPIPEDLVTRVAAEFKRGRLGSSNLYPLKGI